MNRNNANARAIIVHTVTLFTAIVISLMLIVLIANIIIFPVILFATSHPHAFTRIITILFYIAFAGIVIYLFFYRMVLSHKAGIPIAASMKKFFTTPLRYLGVLLFILLALSFLFVILYVILSTNYMFLYKIIH